MKGRRNYHHLCRGLKSNATLLAESWMVREGLLLGKPRSVVYAVLLVARITTHTISAGRFACMTLVSQYNLSLEVPLPATPLYLAAV